MRERGDISDSSNPYFSFFMVRKTGRIVEVLKFPIVGGKVGSEIPAS